MLPIINVLNCNRSFEQLLKYDNASLSTEHTFKGNIIVLIVIKVFQDRQDRRNYLRGARPYLPFAEKFCRQMKTFCLLFLRSSQHLKNHLLKLKQMEPGFYGKYGHKR